MIRCPICQIDNTNLQVICKNCGSYLQKKVENINLFEILWLLVENPQKGMKTVAIAKHKNFVFFISMLFGISLIYIFYEIIKLYDHWNNPLLIIVSGIIFGIPLGFITLFFLLFLTIILKKIFKLINLQFRQTYSALTYSTIPFIYLLIVIFPIKLLAFGINTFSGNPSPVTINSTVYWIILAISILFLIYFLFLLIVAYIVLFELKIFKAILFTFVVITVIIISYAFILNFLNNHLSNF